MSYILDALKRADAERERDAAAVPDLHAQVDAARSTRSSTRSGGWAMLAIATVAVALGVLAWRWFSATPADAAPPPLAQAPVAAPTPAPVPTERPLAAAPLPAPLPTMPAPATAVASPPPRVAAPAPAVPSTRPATPAATAAVAAGRVAAPASSATEARLPSMAELPADIRGQLPALTVGGSVYSPTPASRIVILNGQVFREGDKPVDGLTVEQIRLKSTVLAFRGVRFELKH